MCVGSHLVLSDVEVGMEAIGPQSKASYQLEKGQIIKGHPLLYSIVGR